MYKRGYRFGYRKKEQPTNYKAPYTIYNPHTGPTPLHPESKDGRTYIQICAIDPGIVNCGLRVERIWNDNTVEVMLYCIINFTVKDYDKKPLYEDIGQPNFHYINAMHVIKPYVSLLSESQYIVLESQMYCNPDLIRMSQHIISMLCVWLSDKGCRPLIIEIDSRTKTQLLNAPSKVDIKKWSAEKAKELFVRDNDKISLDFINSRTKQDDLGDVKLYIEVWKIILCSGLVSAEVSLKPPYPVYLKEAESSKNGVSEVQTTKKIVLRKIQFPSK